MIACVTSALGWAPASAMADAERGKALHAEHCVSCHVSLTGGDANGLYTRKERKVQSLDALRAQVRRCEQNLNLTWFDDDVDAVTQYLNEQFYHY
jgi:mono/diheme cytochrome c family protein